MTQPPAYPPGAPEPGPYGYTSVAPPASKAMAITALVLSLLVCIPFLAAVAAAILAVIVISRSNDGRDHGKGLAIAALVIAGLVLVAHSVLLVVGLISGFDAQDDAVRDESGEITESGAVSAFDLELGDCFDDPALSGVGEGEIESEEVSAIPCEQPHEFEVYHVFDVPGDDYPGTDEVIAAADQGCMEEFEPFVGRTFRRSILESYSYYPQESSWRLQDDRAVVCVIDDPDAKTTGSLRDARR